MQQVTRSQSDDSTNVNSGSPASTDAASASLTEPRDATYALPIGILSRLVELSFEPIMVWDWHSGIWRGTRAASSFTGTRAPRAWDVPVTSCCRRAFPNPSQRSSKRSSNTGPGAGSFVILRVRALRSSSRVAGLGTLTAMITRQSRHLTRLLDDLLDVSRIARGRIVLQSEPLEIGEMIGPAIEMVQPLMNEKLHKLRVDRPGQPLHVHGDRARLVQCLCNLLNNSAKYSAARSEIVLVVAEAPDSVTIEVRDNGAGISPELLPHIFDLFIQGERSLDRSQGGLGIGLSIVKRLVEMHQGTVSAASEGIGRGCTFSIRLPRMAAPERAAADCVAPTAPKRRILVVDDNSDVADSLAMLLRLEGHEVEIAYSAPGTFEAVQRMRPEAVFLDIGLPQMDGYEIARRLRADPAAKRVHLIALTGYGQEHDRERAREAGFGAHLVKPADIEAVNQILASLPAGP